MNGAECEVCGSLVCKCEDIARNTKRREQFEAESEIIEQVYQALMKPKGLRFKILKWLYPEIVSVADRLREYYWSK